MIPAVDVGRQHGQPDAQWCWSDNCARTAPPGRGDDILGLCAPCATEILGRCHTRRAMTNN